MPQLYQLFGLGSRRHPVGLNEESWPKGVMSIDRSAVRVSGLRLLEDARLLLIDDRAADTAARARGLEITGTIGILIRAAQLGLVDLTAAFSRLRETNFRCRPELLDAILAKHGTEKGAG